MTWFSETLILDFLELDDDFNEQTLEEAILKEGEDSPIGLILCAEGNNEKIELLELEKSEIRVAEYITELPLKELLKEKLHRVIERQKKRLESKG